MSKRIKKYIHSRSHSHSHNISRRTLKKTKSFKKYSSSISYKKKYFKNLNFPEKSECIKKIFEYHHPQNQNYTAIFPFIINYNEANKEIFNNLLSENTGLNINEWLEQNHILSGQCSKETPKGEIKSSKSSSDGKCHHHDFHHRHHNHGHHKHVHHTHGHHKHSHKHSHGHDNHHHHHHHKVDLILPIKESINLKLQSSVYELINTTTVINTFNYLFQKIGTGIYVQIKNNKIKSFIPFINNNFVNEWFELIKLPSKYKNLSEYYQDKQKILGGKIKYMENMSLWSASNCLLQTEKMMSINDSNWSELYQMLEETCNEHQIDDVDFFLNIKSFPVLKNDFTEPFEHIYGEGELLKTHNYSSYHPILSVSTNDTFGDLPYPSAEDWRLITQDYFRNTCDNKFVEELCKPYKQNFEESETTGCDKHNHNLEWDKKENKAYFLGDSSGCGLTLEDNIRLKLVDLGEKNPTLLDFKLTRFSKRDKINMETNNFNFHDPSKFKFNPVGNQQGLHGRFKYLISVPSYGNDPDLPYFLSLGGLVLKVENDYNTWYDHLLKPYQHYIPVKNDLSNLLAIVKWATTHDETCKKIAKNGYIAYRKFFNRKNVLEYWNYLLNSIAHHRLDLTSLENKYQEYEGSLKILNPISLPLNDLDSIDFKNNKLGIIIPYYKLDETYKNTMKDMVNNLINHFRKFPQLKFKIIICEQKKSNQKFNKGQLINLGLLIAKSNGCTHVVVNNINLIISEEMIPYYFSFEEANKGPVNIGFKWNDYYQKRFLNDICLWNLDMLFKMGGYANQIWGVGCDEKILYHRYIKYLREIKKSGHVYIPILNKTIKNYELESWGQIIDPQYQRLKILGDWMINKHNDIKDLNKYLSEIMNAKNRKGTTCHVTENEHSHSHSHIHDKDEDENESGSYDESETYKKYKSYLKILDKHQHQKEVEHYTFKLISHLEKDIIE